MSIKLPVSSNSLSFLRSTDMMNYKKYKYITGVSLNLLLNTFHFKYRRRKYCENSIRYKELMLIVNTQL